jgi:hypothetical protein
MGMSSSLMTTTLLIVSLGISAIPAEIANLKMSLGMQALI